MAKCGRACAHLRSWRWFPRSVMHLERKKTSVDVQFERERRPNNSVILSGAGQHGRSRRTSNIRGFLSGAWERLVPRSARSAIMRPRMNIGNSDAPLQFLATRRTTLTDAPLKNPQDTRGPSTAPMIVSTAPQTSRKASSPRSAQDDKCLDTALALGDRVPHGTIPRKVHHRL
jgi:hypothetical protein